MSGCEEDIEWPGACFRKRIIWSSIGTTHLVISSVFCIPVLPLVNVLISLPLLTSVLGRLRTEF